MAEKLFGDLLYGDLLSPTPGYCTDFAMGMTYSLSFEALLTAQLAFGMLGETDDNVIQSPHILLEAITKNSDKMVIFCNKGGITVPPTIRKVYSLMEKNIFEVFDKNNSKANFHPKLWLIREINRDDKKDILLKLIVTSRNMAYSDAIDCVACLTGKVSSSTEKNNSLTKFIKEVVKASNIDEEQAKRVKKLAKDLERVKFNVEYPFEDYEFYPYLFGKDFGIPDTKDYLVGTESIIISPFIDKTTIGKLNPNNKCQRTLITRKQYVDKDIFNSFEPKGGTYIALDDLASRGMDLHAKMYFVFQGRDNQHLYLGSANATNKAFTHNGEFLLGLKFRSGNSHAGKLLKEFYEEGNSDSKFTRLKSPMENAETSAIWDSAETAMKKLMCTEDLTARITRHHNGSFSITVTASKKKLENEVFISPLQRKDLMQKWIGRAYFDQLKADELSEFFILSAISDDGTHHETIVKIETAGMPSDRDQAIFKGIIKSKKDFFRFLELMLTDTPLQYISSELLNKFDEGTGTDSSKSTIFPDLYEKMLRIAADNPAQIREIGKLMNKLGDEVVPQEFKQVYKQFEKVLK